MSLPSELPSNLHAPLIDALFVNQPPATNADLDLRAQMHAQEAVWQPTKLPGLSLCVLEFRNGANPGMTALARVDPNSTGIIIPATELELLVQHGIIADDDTEYLHPYYLREVKLHPKAKRSLNSTWQPVSYRSPIPSVAALTWLTTACGYLDQLNTQKSCHCICTTALIRCWYAG